MLLVVALLAIGLPRLHQARAVPLGEVLYHDVPAAGGWAAAYTDERGRPGRFDPCAPVHYTVNPAALPPTGRADLERALGLVAQASGLHFVDDGDTDEAPSRERSAYQPQRYGQRWAPLLIAWVPGRASDLGLDGAAVGVSIAAVRPGTAGPHLVSGLVALDSEQRLPGGFGPGTTGGEVLLHELAHAVGLGHVTDATQVMYPQTTNSESAFGAGDRAGLAAVGAAAGCYPPPEPSA